MKSLLDCICEPNDLASLSISDLEILAQEIRKTIIETLSITGGHLSSNLGIVELTIAIHCAFRSPFDKVTFDVGHQSYTHKLLTNRSKRFHCLRQYHGLSGFCHPAESPHDPFYSGHAGTALSLSLGAAKARDHHHEMQHIIAVLGDASLTSGLTLEALNNVSKTTPRLIVILNDNARSISESVGNIKNILSRLINHPTSNRIARELEEMLSKLPLCGHTLERILSKMKEGVKNFVSAAPFFEQFGFSYVGPIDGHDIEKLITTLRSIQNQPHPILLHVMTQKGKGMPAAIAHPTAYHGVQPFDLQSGELLPSSTKKTTFPQIFGKTMVDLAEKDPNLFAITPAMASGSCLEKFQERFPDRLIDVGIAEGHAVTFAGGLASHKKNRVVVCIYASFFQRALDNLFHDICMQNFPAIIALDRSFLSGPDGCSHHGIYDIAFLNAMPSLIIVQPRNGQVLAEVLSSAFSWKSPVAIRYPNLETSSAVSPLMERHPAQAEILQEGHKILIIGLGHHCQTALEVHSLLLQSNVRATVVDPVFVKPIDQTLFNDLLLSHSFVVTIEEHAQHSGFGMIFNSFIVQNGYKGVEVLNFAIPDRWIAFGSHSELIQEIGLDSGTIAKRILREWGNDLIRTEEYVHRTISQ